jgi:hypothetical protein
MALRDIEIGKLYFVTEVPDGILCSIIGIPFRVSSVSWPFLTVELATNQGRHIILDSRLATINRSNQEYFDKVATMVAAPISQNPSPIREAAIDKAIQNGYSRHDLGGWADTSY